MRHVKRFEINGIKTRQTACIELQGKPNAATKGQIGSLAIDVTSPLREVYKCVGVNGNTYTWELLVDVMGADCAEKVKTINNKLIKFFFGTMAEYAALSDEEKQDLFAITTDGTTDNDVLSVIRDLSGALSTHTNHTYPLVASVPLYEGFGVSEVRGLSAGIYLVVLRYYNSIGGWVEISGVGYIGIEPNCQYVIHLDQSTYSSSESYAITLRCYYFTEGYHDGAITMDQKVIDELKNDGSVVKFYKMGGI